MKTKKHIHWNATQLGEVLAEAQKIIASGVAITKKELWETAQCVLADKYHRPLSVSARWKLNKLLAAAPQPKRQYRRKAKIANTPPRPKPVCVINFCPGCGVDVRTLQPLCQDGPLNFCPACGFSLKPFNT